jgi:hypothetical protein
LFLREKDFVLSNQQGTKEMRGRVYVVRGCMFLGMLILALRAFIHFESRSPHQAQESSSSSSSSSSASSSTGDVCEGRRVFVHELPTSFNTDLLQRCNKGLADWIDFCDHWVNDGFGQRVDNPEHWYATNNYLLEVMFHRRIVTYPCRTLNPWKAQIFFLPYYGGLEALEYLYGEKKHLRNSQGLDLVHWLEHNAAEIWSRHGGADHFMVLGRTAWDFFRQNETSWGTRLLQQVELAHVHALVLEKMPWEPMQEAVPYPTSFHPPSLSALQEWMQQVQIHQPYYSHFLQECMYVQSYANPTAIHQSWNHLRVRFWRAVVWRL